MNRDEIIEYAVREFELFRVEKGIPGIAFGLIYQGELVYAAGLGESVLGNKTPPTADTVFRIASMTKSFTASAIVKLRDKGLIKLDDLITKYLPWSSTIGLPEGSAPITIRDLLTMGAGLPTDDPWGDRQEDLLIADFDAMVAGGLTFNRNVNTGFEYSNLSYALLGRIISQVTGEDFETYMEREILTPVGMNASTYFSSAIPNESRAVGYAKFDSGLTPEPHTKHGAFTPMGGLHSSVKDLTKWINTFDGEKVEQQTPYRHAYSIQAPAEGEISERIIVGAYGYGLFVHDDAVLGRFIHHSGGYPGFGSHMRWHQGSGWAIIGLGNLTYAPMITISAKVLNQIVASQIKLTKPTADLGPSTVAAMGVVNTLINKWDHTLSDEWLSENIALDRPIHERVTELEALTSGRSDWKVVPDSIKAPTKSHAKWEVESAGSILKVEILMSPEKSPKIQKLTVTASS